MECPPAKVTRQNPSTAQRRFVRPTLHSIATGKSRLEPNRRTDPLSPLQAWAHGLDSRDRARKKTAAMTTMVSPSKGLPPRVVDWKTNRTAPFIAKPPSSPVPRLPWRPASTAPIGEASMRPHLNSPTHCETADQTPRNRNHWDDD